MHKYNTAKMLKLQGFKVKLLKEDKEKIHIKISTQKSIHICPVCNSETNKIHDYLPEQIINHILINKKQVKLHIKKRRYHCCNCNKKFIENYEIINKYERYTNPLILNVMDDLKIIEPFKRISERYNMSIGKLNTLFKMQSFILSKPLELPENLGIDEF